MSGVRTLEDLRERCRIDEFTGCWLWSGAMSKGVPRVWSAAVGRTVTGSRLAWELNTGKPPPDGKTVYRVACCDLSCVNPQHLKLGTKADNGAAIRASGHFRGNPVRAMKNMQNGMRSSKATPELRALILASDEPATTLGPKIGIDHATVSMVRQGKRWAGLPGSSVFTWRGLA